MAQASLLELTARLAVAHAREIREVRQALDLDILLVSVAATSAKGSLREVVADVAAVGGKDGEVLVRRPLLGPGPLAMQVTELLCLGQGKGKGNNKGQGKGKGKGRGGGKGKGGGRRTRWWP